MNTQEPMLHAGPPIAGQTGDAYRAAFRALADKAEAFIEEGYWEDGDVKQDKLDKLVREARTISRHLSSEIYRQRERLTAADSMRSGLRDLCAAIDEYEQAHEFEGGALGLDVFDGFEREVKHAVRRAVRVDEWAPEDETNPVKVVAVPVPDPSAEPINRLGVRQGDWIKASWDTEPRQILTGVESSKSFQSPSVRVSSDRDGSTLWGGHWVPADRIGGEDYPVVPAPTSGQKEGSTDA